MTFTTTDSVTRTLLLPGKALRPDAWRKAKELGEKHGARVGVGLQNARESTRLRVNLKFALHSWYASNQACAAFANEWRAWATSNGLRAAESIGPHYWVTSDTPGT